MTSNVGGTERPIRIILGLLLVGVALFGGIPTAGVWILGVIGAMALVTGAIGYCPAWTLFGIDTCSTKLSGKG